MLCHNGLADFSQNASPPPQRPAVPLVAQRAAQKKPRRGRGQVVQRDCRDASNGNPHRHYHSRLHSARVSLRRGEGGPRQRRTGFTFPLGMKSTAVTMVPGSRTSMP